MSSGMGRGIALGVLVFLLVGCGQSGSGSPKAVVTTETGPAEPGQIELSDPTVTFEAPNLVRMEVRYRFVKGRPSKHYMCEITFPGTKNQGSKPMSSWELKPEGVIKDGFVLSNPPVEKFEIRMSEADSPQDGYKPNSNVVSGKVK